MKNWFPESDEFFIGYLPSAPKQTSSFITRLVILLGLGILIVSCALVLSQRDFSKAEFEYGTFTKVEGVLFTKPIPHIQRLDTLQSLILVGPGKMGAEPTLDFYNDNMSSLNGHRIAIEGQLIHGDGKAFLQIDPLHGPTILEYQSKTTVWSGFQDVGRTSIQGEIVDPKCFFGVMKPGEGKPHRSCAIRCISGGIPPVFHQQGTSEYFLLLDEKFQPLNSEVVDIVGDQVVLEGMVTQMQDWKILRVNRKSLSGQASLSRGRRLFASMQDGIAQCSMK